MFACEDKNIGPIYTYRSWREGNCEDSVDFCEKGAALVLLVLHA